MEALQEIFDKELKENSDLLKEKEKLQKPRERCSIFFKTLKHEIQSCEY